MRALLPLLTAFLAAAHAFGQDCSESPVKASKQLVLSIAPHWNSKKARIERFVRDSKSWHAVDTGPVSAVVGKNGLGWGSGLHPEEKGKFIKNEGDGRAPVGAFRLVEAFGSHPGDELGLKEKSHLPYTQVSADSKCVDDPKSYFYNTMIYDQTKVKKDWDSREDLRRKDDLYEFGIVVDHNQANITSDKTDRSKAKGSCIFLHVWREDQAGTAGCTAMGKENVRNLISWLDSERQPMLVQLPLSEYFRLKEKWCLPEINLRDWMNGIVEGTEEELAEVNQLIQEHCQ